MAARRELSGEPLANRREWRYARPLPYDRRYIYSYVTLGLLLRSVGGLVSSIPRWHRSS